MSSGMLSTAAASTTPAPPIAPVAYPAVSPVRRPKRWESRPTMRAAPADPAVNRATGSPDRLLVSSMSAASSAPTVMPAASPAPLKTWEAITTVRVLRCRASRAAGESV